MSVGKVNLIESGAMTNCANRELSRIALEALDAYRNLSQENIRIESNESKFTSKRPRRRQKSVQVSRETSLNHSAGIRSPSGLTVNDYFFEHQKNRGYINGSPIISKSAEVRHLNSLLSAQVEAYFQDVVRKEVAEGISTLIQNEMLSLDLWAAVQQGQGAYHKDHVHEGVLLSGVYYSAVPEGSAPLVLHRPSDLDSNHKGRADDLEREKILQPIEGQVIIFPPWLLHGVPSIDNTVDTGQARVSFAFNLKGIFGGGEPWELTRR